MVLTVSNTEDQPMTTQNDDIQTTDELPSLEMILQVCSTDFNYHYFWSFRPFRQSLCERQGKNTHAEK